MTIRIFEAREYRVTHYVSQIDESSRFEKFRAKLKIERPSNGETAGGIYKILAP